MPGALAVVKFSGRKSSDRKCSNNDLKEIFAKSNSISWGEFLRSSDRKCHTYGLKETVVKSNAYSQEQNFKGENGGGIFGVYSESARGAYVPQKNRAGAAHVRPDFCPRASLIFRIRQCVQSIC